MKRKTLGITTALAPGAALAATGTPAANPAPQPRSLTQQEALHAAAEQAGTISSALGPSGGEQLVPRHVVRDADGTGQSTCTGTGSPFTDADNKWDNGTCTAKTTAGVGAAHEMSHGVTSATAGLIYSGESGGLGEATSDLFGSTTKFHAANTTDHHTADLYGASSPECAAVNRAWAAVNVK